MSGLSLSSNTLQSMCSNESLITLLLELLDQKVEAAAYTCLTLSSLSEVIHYTCAVSIMTSERVSHVKAPVCQGRNSLRTTSQLV